MNEFLLGNLKKVRLNLYSDVGISFSKLKLTEYFMVLDQKLTDKSYSYKAQNYFFEPGFNISNTVLFLNVGLYSGYLIGFGKQAHYTNNDKKVKLYSPETGESIKPDWNGFRFGISVSYILDRRKD